MIDRLSRRNSMRPNHESPTRPNTMNTVTLTMTSARIQVEALDKASYQAQCLGHHQTHSEAHYGRNLH